MEEERHTGRTAAMQAERIPFVATLATAATRWSTRWVPDAYVLAILLTVIASIMALAFTPAWGDMMTAIIQPFWAIPLLSVARLRFRDIMGFAIVIFLVYLLLTSAGFLVAPFFFR